MTGNLITWNRGDYADQGVAGGVALFSISWHTRRDSPDWIMRSALPGLTGRTWESDDRNHLKAAAETALAEWVARVTAKEA